MKGTNRLEFDRFTISAAGFLPYKTHFSFQDLLKYIIQKKSIFKDYIDWTKKGLR